MKKKKKKTRNEKKHFILYSTFYVRFIFIFRAKVKLRSCRGLMFRSPIVSFDSHLGLLFLTGLQSKIIFHEFIKIVHIKDAVNVFLLLNCYNFLKINKILFNIVKLQFQIRLQGFYNVQILLKHPLEIQMNFPQCVLPNVIFFSIFNFNFISLQTSTQKDLCRVCVKIKLRKIL